MSAPGAAGLAAVTDGWTDPVAVTYGLCTVEVRPTPRTSPAEFWAAVVRRCRAVLGQSVTWRGWADASGRLYIGVSGSDTFSMVITSGNASRLGFTAGTHSGATSYTASSAHAGAVGYGEAWGVAAARLSSTRGVGLTDGSGGLAPSAAPVGAEVQSWEDADTLVERLGVLGGVYDVWMDGRVRARVRLDRAALARWGERGSSLRLSMAGDEVSG